ncbi:hypothetical protein PanWU01x14_188000, partial [Parasponia andersonii]
ACSACDGRFTDRLVAALGGFTFGWPSKRNPSFVETLLEHWLSLPDTNRLVLLAKFILLYYIFIYIYICIIKQRRIVTEWFILRPCHFRGISVLCPKALSSAFGVRLP